MSRRQARTQTSTIINWRRQQILMTKTHFSLIIMASLFVHYGCQLLYNKEKKLQYRYFDNNNVLNR